MSVDKPRDTQFGVGQKGLAPVFEHARRLLALRPGEVGHIPLRHDLVHVAVKGVVVGYAHREVVAGQGFAVKVLQQDADVVGVLHHLHRDVAVGGVILPHLGFLQTSVEERMELSAYRGGNESGTQAHPEILQRSRLRIGREGEGSVLVLHAAVSEYGVCARLQINRHAPLLVTEEGAVGACVPRHAFTLLIVEEDGQAVRLGGECVGELHVVVIDET